ncbi:hypothetical protein Tco_0756740 [Tanacetum coccineum]
MKAICNLDVHVDPKAPKPSSQTEEVPQGKKPGAKSGLRIKQSSKHTSESKTKASKSKTGQSEKETQFSYESEEEEEEEVAKDKDTHASFHDARPLFPNINQLTHLLVTSLKPELSKLLASHNFASGLPTELKELPSKFAELSREIKELKQHVKDMEIELPGDLKKIPTKLETFTSTISNLTSQVAELKNIQWELPTEFQALPVLVFLVQTKLKTLDSLPSLLNKVTETLTRFATVVENASRATTKDVPSARQATTSPAEGEKNTTKDAETNLQNELVDLLGIDVVEQYHKKKLLFDIVTRCRNEEKAQRS